MKKDVMISIKGLYNGEEDADALELITVGQLFRRPESDSYYIRYEETEATGYVGCTTTLKIEGDQCVTISRTGAQQTNLVIEKNRRHLCHYDTGFGSFTVGVYSDLIESNLNDHGGAVRFCYTLDVDTSLAAENDVTVSVREC